MAELPIVCGDLWAVAAWLNETRDALISELANAGFPATICNDPPAGPTS